MKHTSRIIFSFLVLLFGFAALHGASWYVDNAASGNGSGTSWGNAWKSLSGIRWGSSGVQPGDTLYISGGSAGKTYRETLSVGAAGTPSARIAIRPGQDAGHNGLVTLDGDLRLAVGITLNEYVTLDGANSQGKIGIRITRMTQKGVSAVNNGSVSGIKIKSLQIENCGTRASGLTKPGYAHGIHVLNANGIEISYNLITGSYKDGVNLGGSKGSWGNNRIHHNYIHHNGDDGITGGAGMEVYNNTIHDHKNLEAGHPDGVQILGNYTRIYNNISYNNANSQIFWDPLENGRDAAHARIYNNLVYHSDGGNGKGGYSRGIAVKGERNTTGVSDLVIANNTVVDMSYFGIGVDSNDRRASDITIVNNIVYNSGTNGSQAITVYGFSSSSNVVIDYNQVNAGPNGDGEIRFGRTFIQAHGSTARPAFISHTLRGRSNNFQIVSPSGIPGMNLSSHFTTDIGGTVRSIWEPGCFISGRTSVVALPTDQIPSNSPDPSMPSDPIPGWDNVPEGQNPSDTSDSVGTVVPSTPKGFKILN